MKNLILVTFLSLILTLSIQAFSQTSTEQPATTEHVTTTPPVQSLSFFGNIWDSIKTSGIWVVITFICGILSKNGVTKIVKAVAGKTTIVTHELSDVSMAVSNFSDLIDKAIKDDGSVDENSLKQAANAGKTVIAETKDAWVTIKPKPTGIPAV